MTSTNHSDFSLSSGISDQQLLLIRVFTISTSVLGTLGNSLTVVAILKGRLYENPSFLFILNLSVCNLIHCVIQQPLLAIQAFHGIWSNNEWVCVMYGYFLFSNLGTELWGYTCITFNRYFCVVQYQIYQKIYGNTKIIVAMLTFSWLFYPVVLFLPLTKLWGRFLYAPQKLVCYPFAGYHCTGFCLFIYSIAILSTVPVILFCYSAIIHKYSKSQKKVGLARERSTSKDNTVIAKTVKTDNDRNRTMNELRMAFTILAVITVFGTCRLPFMILYVYDPSMSKVDPLIHTVLIHIGSSSNWINPIIYSFSNKTIFTILKKLFTSKRDTFIVQS